MIHTGVKRATRRPAESSTFVSVEVGPRGPAAPTSTVLLAAWIGLATGMVELAMFAAYHKLGGRIGYETLWTNRHYAWMIPVSNLAIFATLGLAAALPARLIPRPLAVRATVHGFGFLSAYALASFFTKLHWIAILALAVGISARLGSFVLARPVAFARFVRRTTPCMAVGVVVLFAWKFNDVTGREARAEAATPPSAPGSPNIVLMVLDTVRADAMSLYGSKRATTPVLAELAARGVKYEHARSVAPWTLPSHASLFTGRWPHELSVGVGRPLDDARPTLAESLAARGYRTGAFVGNTHNCNAWYGLDRGFARYEDHYQNTWITPLEILRGSRLGTKIVMRPEFQRVIKSLFDVPPYLYRKTAAMINRDALAWLDRDDSRPFFLFLNYYDAHDPYVVPAGAPRVFETEGAKKPARTPLERQRDGYDDCLAYLDAEIGKLIDRLKAKGVLENTVIVVTSDHGEAFGEHDLVGHGVSLFRPELHIPLLVVDPRDPESAGRIVGTPVSLRDVTVTVDRLSGRVGESPFEGRVLTDLIRSDAGSSFAPVLSEVDRAAHLPDTLKHVPASRGRMWSLVSDRHVYIRMEDGDEQLYDFAADPHESDDLADSTAAEATLRILRGMMDDLMTD